MTLAGFKARNHRQQVAKRGSNPTVDDRATPPETFDPLNQRFGFTLDVAALAHNAKLPRYFTPDEDGLLQAWGSERVWCNPPYSSIAPWLEKAWTEWALTNRPGLIVMLLPANRTEQRWWQEHVEPYRDRNGSDLTVEFLSGRTRFICVGENRVLPNQRPPFGCCLVIWEKRRKSQRK